MHRSFGRASKRVFHISDCCHCCCVTRLMSARDDLPKYFSRRDRSLARLIDQTAETRLRVACVVVPVKATREEFVTNFYQMVLFSSPLLLRGKQRENPKKRISHKKLVSSKENKIKNFVSCLRFEKKKRFWINFAQENVFAVWLALSFFFHLILIWKVSVSNKFSVMALKTFRHRTY